MRPFPYEIEERSAQLSALIDARIQAIKNDIRLGRVSTLSAVLAQVEGLECMREEAVALVTAAVTGCSRAVGGRIAAIVSIAIYLVAAPLAEADLVLAERTGELCGLEV